MVSGLLLRDAIISASNNISNFKKEVDELNIFPVPDGDTGTNMSMTIAAGAKGVASLPDEASIGEVAEINANALLRGARGNSGVILSLLFRGFGKALKGKETATSEDLIEALEIGVKAAYKAVMKPTEGTMLTVSRVAAETGRELLKTEKDSVLVWKSVCEGAEKSLELTPELLPVLKRAGVVDAGGKGLVLIFEGMFNVFKGKGIIEPSKEGKIEKTESVLSKNAAAEFDEEITFTYCTEFIVKRDLENVSDDDALALRGFLENIGDSVVVVDDDTIIKIHVHTENPGDALQAGLKFGQLINLKIENMRDQHEQAKIQAGIIDTPAVPVDPERDFGFVAVASGEGLKTLFIDLGCDHVVTGGQSMNPSTDDILKAIQATPAKTVFVLPNNKNIILAAEQAINMADRNVVVVPTRTIPQGLSALLAFDPEAKDEDNVFEMINAAERVSTGSVTYAARDSEFAGHKIKEGEIIALDNGKLVFTEKTPVRAVVKLARSLVTKESSFVTLIHGEDVSEGDAEEARSFIQARVPAGVEVTAVNGGQPIYYFIISVE